MENLSAVEVCEADVERIEAATDRFLGELKDVLAEVAEGANNKRVLQ